MYRMRKLKRAVSLSLIASLTMANVNPGYISAEETEVILETQYESTETVPVIQMEEISDTEPTAEVITAELVEETSGETQNDGQTEDVYTETAAETEAAAPVEEETSAPETAAAEPEQTEQETESSTARETESEGSAGQETETAETAFAESETVKDTEEDAETEMTEEVYTETVSEERCFCIQEDAIQIEVIDKHHELPEDTRILFKEIDPQKETKQEEIQLAQETIEKVSEKIKEKLLDQTETLNELILYEIRLEDAQGNELNLSEDAEVVITYTSGLEWEGLSLEGHHTELALMDQKEHLSLEKEAKIRLGEQDRIQSIGYETDQFYRIMLIDILDEDGEMQDEEDAVLTVQADDGVVITITAPTSSLPYAPEEITATAKHVTDETASSLVGAAVKDTELENGDVYFYEISLWHDSEEIEPIGPVVVTFEGFEEDAEQNARVFHIDENRESITDMNAERTESGTVVMNTDHFSIYGVAFAARGNNDNIAITSTMSGQWDQTEHKLTGITFSMSGSEGDVYYQIQYSDDNGTTWQQGSDESDKTQKDKSVSVSIYTSVIDSGSLTRQYRAYGAKKNNKGDIQKEGWGDSFTIYDILENVKEGFLQWLDDSYVQYYGGTAPTDLTTLYDAFAVYYGMPNLEIASELKSSELYVNATVDGSVLERADVSYFWEYQEEDGSWAELCTDTTPSVNASKIDLLLHGGKEVRCRLYEVQGGNKTLKAMSDPLYVNPLRELYDKAIAEINDGLSLGTLEINGTKFTDYFYYDNVAKDARVPFKDAGTYADYLAKTYLDAGGGSAGLSAVRSQWDYYLYDLYDPSDDNNTLGNIKAYPAGTYGDNILEWPKDSASSFHGSGEASVEKLDYDYIENGMDYSKFVKDLRKTVKADAAGDQNTERTYQVDITADTGEPVVAPVAMILQIQTSWQMFDLLHANALKGEGVKTEVGAVANNTALANLYDIKRALLRFVDYIDQKYPGNNLVLAVTETQHAGSQTMLKGTDANGNTLYVSNNSANLKQQLLQWDSFGNCEHVHYDTKTLVAAVQNLKSNLSVWTDKNGTPIDYDDIEKVAVIIGGPTENKNDNNGYACTLPWSTFASNDLNGVYSIRTNEGTSYDAGIISWLDNTANNSGSAYLDGTGTTFTGKYVATTEDAVYQSLVDIAEREMTRKGLNSIAKSKYIENVTVTDVISDEFELNTNEQIRAMVYDMEGNEVSNKPLALTDPDLTVTANADGTTKIVYDFGDIYNTQTCVLHFGIIAKDDYLGSNNVYSNVGTPTLTFQHTKVDMYGNPTGTVEDFSYDCTNTPQVNVPVNFTIVDGETSNLIINDQVDLADLSNDIVKDVEARITKYDQINGTLNYLWELPDGTTLDVGSIAVKDGDIGTQTALDRSYTYIGTTKGQYTGTLKVTFTPDPADTTSTNFADSKTATGVNALTKEGKVWINVTDQGMIYIKKKVDNYQSELAGDSFVINVAAADQSVNTQLVLTHNQISAGIVISGTTELTLTEILPKEYTSGQIELSGNGATVSGNKVTVQAGKIVTITVHNVYEGKSYFHASDAVTNHFK